MWLEYPIREILETLESIAPDARSAMIRSRGEMLDLLVALFRPAAEDPETILRAKVASALDAELARRGVISPSG